VYLARGRDVEKPAIIVLLDSDKGGNEAKKSILRGGPKRNQLLNPNYILQLGDLLRLARVLGPFRRFNLAHPKLLILRRGGFGLTFI
jgi:hypothetical protein